MGDFLRPPCKHNIEHLPCTIDVPLSLGHAGKGSFSLASHLQEDFTSSNLDVYGMSSLYLQLSEHHHSMANACPTRGYCYDGERTLVKAVNLAP